MNININSSTLQNDDANKNNSRNGSDNLINSEQHTEELQCKIVRSTIFPKSLPLASNNEIVQVVNTKELRQSLTIETCK